MTVDRSADAASDSLPLGAESDAAPRSELSPSTVSQLEELRALAERRATRLQKLYETGSQLARSLDEATIFRTLALQIESILPVASILIEAIDVAGGSSPRVYLRGRDEVDPASAPAAMQALGLAAAESQRVTAQDGMLAVPALLAGSVSGVIVVATPTTQRVDRDDVELLLTIGAQAAAAVSNARLYAESQRQRRQTEALADVARAVSESLRLDSVLRLILRHAVALLRSEGATIGLLRGDSVEIVAGFGAGEAMVGVRLPVFGSISGRAIRTLASIIADDVRLDPDSTPELIVPAVVRNTIIVPLSSANGPVGVLTVFNRADSFTVDDAEVLQRLADQVAMAVVNARLFEEVADSTREWVVAFDAIGLGMVLLDREGRIQRSNARARALMGVANDAAIVGRPFHAVLFAEEGPCDACVHMTAIREGAVARGSHGVRSRGIVYDITAAPHPLGGAVVTFDDVTEHRALAERYRLVVETTSDGIVITDRDREISFANRAAIELFGRGPDLLGQSAAITVSPDLHDMVRDREDRAFAGEPQQYESVVDRPGGESRLIAVRTAPLRELGTVTGIVASLRDITEQRRARDAVAQSELRYSNLFDSATDSIYTLDARGAFTSANQATCELTGLTRGELLGQSTRPLVEPDDYPLVMENFRRSMAGESVRYECRFRGSNGEVRFISVSHTPIQNERGVSGVLGVARDMTRERESAAALARSEAQYERLVESASDGIFTVDAEGRFSAVNRAFERAVGRSRSTLIGAPLTELVDPRDMPIARQLLHETFAGERCRGRIRYRSAEGETRHGSLITSPVLDGGAVTGALGIMRDMTDELRIAEQLLQHEKLAAVGQLVSGVAHELNNPLAGVMAFSELLLGSPNSSDAEARQAAETIHREAQRAAKIVSHLLTFARQQPAERVETDLNQLVTDTLELRRYALRSAEIDVVVALDESLPVTWADPFQLQQILLNLMGNAEQALATWNGPRRITVRTWRERNQLLLAVSDTGPGIAMEQRDRIFNPFFTTKPVGQGTGLGLSISDGIAREHGGRIRVESQLGEGAMFVLELPYVSVPQAPVTTAERLTEPPPASRRVLVVDDEPSMRAAISTFLRSLGHEVSIAASGRDARQLLADREYDAILLDLRMTDIGGDVLYHELRSRDPRQAARVVFVTGDTQSDAARRFLLDAGRPTLSKPFQLDDLATVIAAVTQ